MDIDNGYNLMDDHGYTVKGDNAILYILWIMIEHNVFLSNKTSCAINLVLLGMQSIE
jgi:hypothetical protein